MAWWEKLLQGVKIKEIKRNEKKEKRGGELQNKNFSSMFYDLQQDS